MNEMATATARRAGGVFAGDFAGDRSWVNRRTVLALVGVSLTWVFSLTGLQRYAPAGLPASVQAWARECPSCGTVESVAKLVVSPSTGELATAFVYRLTIRMADGSIRRLEQNVSFPPGSQVLVQGGTVRPAAGTAGPARRQ
jgi:hypothetical protein